MNVKKTKDYLLKEKIILSFMVKSNKFICNCDLKSADSRVQDFMMAELEALEASEGLKADLLKMNKSGPN